MHKKRPNQSKIDNGYAFICNEIKLETDPAAKVLSSLILDRYCKEGQFIHFFPGAALIELVHDSAQDVISNTAKLLNRVDSRFSFAFSDFSAEKESCYKDKVSNTISEIYRINDYDPMTIHVIKNVSDCLHDEEALKLLQDTFMHYTSEEFHLIFIFNENSYYQFGDMFINILDIDPIWLHRLPGKADINQKKQDHSHKRVNITTINSSIFTQSGKTLMNRAQRQADLFEENEIDYTSLLLAAAEGVESSVALEQCFNLTPERVHWLREDAEGTWKGIRNDGFYLCGSRAVTVISNAIKMASADGYPDPKHPGLVSSFHLIGALSMSEGIKNDFGSNKIRSYEKAVNQIADWYYYKKVSPSITDNREVLGRIGDKHSNYRKVLGNIFGQQEALHTVNEVLCLAEYEKNDKDKDNGIFACLLFIGPEGSGKGTLARLISEKYDFSLQYFNLSFYSEEQSLTLEPEGFRQYRALLVFENIAEAQPSVINQICRLIESGKYIDQKSGEELYFKNSVVIIIAKSEKDWYLGKDKLITNKLAINQKAVLETLKKNYDHAKGLPLIPTNLLSLLEKHQVVIFNQLKPEDLLNICVKKLVQFGSVVEKNSSIRVTYDPLIPSAIIFSEGGKPKPGAINTAVEMLISAETRKFISGFREDAAKYLLSSYDRLHFSLEDEKHMCSEVARLFRAQKKPDILLFASKETADSYSSSIDQVNWYPVSSYDALELAMNEHNFDFALLDIWFNISDFELKSKLINEFISGLSWHNLTLPFTAISLELFGERYMQIIRQLFVKQPVVMLNQIDSVWDNCVQESYRRPSSYYLDAAEELSIQAKNPVKYPLYSGVFRYDLFMEFLELNCIRGMINSVVTGENTGISEEQRNGLISCIEEVYHKLHRERMAEELFNKGKVLSFKPVWEFSQEDSMVTVRLKDLELERKPEL